MLNKIIILGLLSCGLVAALLAMPNKENSKVNVTKTVEKPSHPSPVVLELFTSQGCSSCPPADILLQKVQRENPDQVFALAYHVDYWNYIGWKDPFSKAVYTKKQSAYNRKLGYSGNYTPELVVNGMQHFVGSNRVKLYSEIERIKKERSQHLVSLSDVKIDGSEVVFQYDVDGPIANKLLRAVLVLDEKTTKILRGENHNRTLTNTHIVVGEAYTSPIVNNGISKISIPAIAKNEDITLMVLLEDENLDILAASKASVP